MINSTCHSLDNCHDKILNYTMKCEIKKPSFDLIKIIPKNHISNDQTQQTIVVTF